MPDDRPVDIVLIAAVAENGVIGRDGGLPWHLPDDLQFFKKMTVGKPIVMGRGNWESLARPLPKRTNIVITRQRDYQAPGAIVTHTVEEALTVARREEPPAIMIIGGSDIYRIALPFVDRMLITRIHAKPEGDVYFPQVDWSRWKRTEAIAHPKDTKHDHAFTYETWIPKT